MAVEREIPITSGEVHIVDEGARRYTEQSQASRAAKRSLYETGNDGAWLEIISTCPLSHVVRTPPGAINGNASAINFAGLGAVQLFAHNGVWIVISADGVTFS